MRAGRLNRRVTVQVPTVTNVKGEESTTWADTTRWAEWNFTGTNERFRGQFFEGATGYFMFRNDSFTRSIDAKCRIVDGDTWEVLGAVDPDGRKREIRVYVDRTE